MMTLNEIADVTYALLVEVRVARGVDRITAINEVGEIGLNPEDRKVQASEPDNQASMAMLGAMLGGSQFGGAFV